jgi:hypothetical protein
MRDVKALERVAERHDTTKSAACRLDKTSSVDTSTPHDPFSFTFL